MSSFLQVFNQQDLNSIIHLRDGEIKLGQKVSLPLCSDWKSSIHPQSPLFVLLGIPEDIGVRANGGIGGAHTAWIPALQSILNIQSTTNFIGDELMILGSFNFLKWMKASEELDQVGLRNLVSKIDDEIFPVIEFLVRNGKIPIVIGGGHNNSYPLLKGSSLALSKAINCINMDAHTDYRQQEGRHSGNGFRYAKAGNYLDKYALIALHENYNSINIMNEISADNDFHFSFFEDIFIKEKLNFSTAIEQAFFHTKDNAVGIELDLDAIQNVLSSAHTPSGITTVQARQYLYQSGQKSNPCYLHIAEGATKLRNDSFDINTAKLIAYLVSDFIKGMK